MDWIEKSRLWIGAEATIEAAHHPVALDLLVRAGLRRGLHVLDIGCGSGGTLMMVADQVGSDGAVSGIDIAPPMTARAANRAKSRPQVAVMTGDAQTHPFNPASHDVAISLFGVMFFADPVPPSPIF